MLDSVPLQVRPAVLLGMSLAWIHRRSADQPCREKKEGRGGPTGNRFLFLVVPACHEFGVNGVVFVYVVVLVYDIVAVRRHQPRDSRAPLRRLPADRIRGEGGGGGDGWRPVAAVLPVRRHVVLQP